MLGNTKFLFKDLKNLFDFKYYAMAFKMGKSNIQKFFQEKIYQIRNIFEVNLNNGLSYLYSKNYRDAKIRFHIMNFFWKKNSCVQYNLGRVYFFLKDFKKAEEYFDNAINFFNPNDPKNKFYNNELSIFFKKKISFDQEIFFVPSQLQKEKYEYLIDQSIMYSANRLKNFQILASIFNHYIWLYKNSDPEIKNLNFLDLGCGLGELGEVLREECKRAKIDGVDFSKKHCLSLKEYQEEITEERRSEDKNSEKNFKIYNRIKVSEMHDFLFENLENLHDKNNSGGEKKQNSRIYDVIFSMGSFGEFGQFGTILELCGMNLRKNGLVIFYVYQGSQNQLEFNIIHDYFCYNLEYIEYIAQNNKNFSIEFIDNKMKINNKEIIFVVLKKIK